MSSSHKGFTLAEVLIALALLGVVAAFTIPKVLQATGNGESTAKIKETVATMEQAWYNRKLQNTYFTGSTCNATTGATTGGTDDCTLYFSLIPDLNTVNNGGGVYQQNGANAATGCGAAGAAGTTGFVQFANGVAVMGLNTATTPLLANLATDDATTENYLLCMDINGSTTPNTLGNDAFQFNFAPNGNFDGTGTAFTASATGKNFFYGSSNTGANTGAFAAGATSGALAQTGNAGSNSAYVGLTR